MSHIFISYSHKDTGYAHKLAEVLQNQGFDVWIDERLDYGSQWPYEIQKQLDSCLAFIVIMSPRAYASEWVQSELQRAKRKLKPVFPMLLEGNEPWLSVESTQYYDVRGEKFPDTRFYSALKNIVPVSQGVQTSAGQPKVAAGAVPVKPGPKSRTGLVLAILGGGAVALVACAAVSVVLIASVFNANPFGPAPTPSRQPAVASLPSEETPILDPPTEVTEQEPPPVSAPDSGDVFDDNGVPMRLIPAGEFEMGSDTSSYGEERPGHTVYLDDYYIDIYEVTNARYKICVDEGGCEPPQDTSSATRSSYFGNPEFDDYPVIYVDWDMAVTYCEWRGAQLPTEAQWEKAARGMDGRSYPWGEGIEGTRVNYNYNVGDTTAVGSYEDGQSPYGLYDMSGNVWEWVADWYSDSYYQDSPASNPPGPESGRFRGLRGGSWLNEEDFVRTFTRGWNELQYFEYTDFGFRCVRDTSP